MRVGTSRAVMNRNGHPPRPSSTSRAPNISINHEERYQQLNPDSDFDDLSQSDEEDDYFLDLELDDDEEEEEENQQNFYERNYFDSLVPPPLPLIDIAPDDSSNPPPKTINGCSLRTINHIRGQDFVGDKLFDPLLSRFHIIIQLP